MSKDTPKKMGYFMPPEWHRHEAVWLAWPYDSISFPDVEEAELTFSAFIRILHRSENINLLVVGKEMESKAKEVLTRKKINLQKVKFHHYNYADIWTRDYGPIFVINKDSKNIAMVKSIFNAWGNKYEELLKDNEIPYAMNNDLGLPLFESGMVLEGGSIDVNGVGTALTTKSCLLNPNRNPNLSMAEIKNRLSEYLGISNIIWLNAGILSDDTDGHIDDVARFISPTQVICAYQDDPKSPNYKSLMGNYQILINAKDQDGNKLQVIKLPMPYADQHHAKHLPASYTNFYIGNGVVIVPLFNTKNDDIALQILKSVFPTRKVYGLDATSLVYGCGTFHCMTQQQPACIS